jgi:hypothetical protein
VTRPALVLSEQSKNEALVRKLATDDEFRARLRRNPTGVLAEYHIDLPSTELPADVVLPPRSQMAAVLHAMTGGHLAPARAAFPPRPKYWPAFRLSLRPAAS